VKVRESGELSPLSSGAGRLFDAISAIIGLCDRNTFEGEAAIAMESLVSAGIHDEYPFELTGGMPLLIDFSPTINGIIGDLLEGRDKRLISTKFHNTLSGVILGVIRKVREVFDLGEILLSGGTFQNMYLLRKTMKRLASEGLKVFINEKVPCNDACISLGQAYLLRERMKKGMHPVPGQGQSL